MQSDCLWKPHLTPLLSIIFPTQAHQRLYHLLNGGQALRYLPGHLPTISTTWNSFPPPPSDFEWSLWITQIACFFHRLSPSLKSLHQVFSSISLCSHSSWAKIGSQVCLPSRYWNPQKRNLTTVVSVLPCVTRSLWDLFHFEGWMNIVSILAWFF